MFWKYAANLQENPFAEVWFQEWCKAHLSEDLFLQHLWVAASVSSTFSCACQLNIRTDIKEIKDKYIFSYNENDDTEDLQIS